MGAVAKKLESSEKRPTDDHTRTGLKRATLLDALRHSLNTYREIAWFLSKDVFMRVSDVEAAFLLLPLAPWLWPFFLFRFFASDEASELTLFMHVCGDFGAAGMPGTFKIFFVDVVVQMARSEFVLTLPLPVYVDDCALIGARSDRVDLEMEAFHAWALEVCGIMFKALKDRMAAQVQLAIGFWWDSVNRTRTLEEQKLLEYLDMFRDFSTRRTLTLHERQSVVGRMQRAVMTLPPGAACLMANTFAHLRGLVLGWQRKRTTKAERDDYALFADLLSLNLGKGYFSYDQFDVAPEVRSDASRSARYAAGGYASRCGRYRWHPYGASARRHGIAVLEGDRRLYDSTETCSYRHES
eukprot:2425961-Prymnesium_polylepis.1